MIKEMKKTIFRNTLIIVFVLLIAGIILTAVSFDGAMAVLGPKKNIYDASVGKIKDANNAKIEIDKYNLYGCFTEEYSETKGVKKTTAYYCLILVGDDSDPRFMAVKVDAKYKDKLDKIEEEYTDLDNGIDSDDRTVITVKGKLQKMDGQLYKYFKDFIMEYEYTEEDLPFVSLNLCLEDKGVNGQTIFFILGGIAILIAVIILVYVLVTGGVSKVKKQFQGMAQEEIERIDNDYLNAACISKHVKIGMYYTFIMSTMKGTVIRNDELVWAYTSKVTHRTNGIPTGTTYSVIVYDVNGKSYSLPSKNEQMCQEILNRYSQISNKMIIGYDDEYMQLFRTDFKRFLSIAYNRIDNVPMNENNGQTGFDNYFS